MFDASVASLLAWAACIDQVDLWSNQTLKYLKQGVCVHEIPPHPPPPMILDFLNKSSGFLPDNKRQAFFREDSPDVLVNRGTTSCW